MHFPRSLRLLLLWIPGIGAALATTIVEPPAYYPSALLFSQTDWPNGSPGFPAFTITLNRFDSNLGTLNSITLDLTATINSSFTILNTGANSPANVFLYRTHMDVSIVDPSVVTPPYDGNLSFSEGDGGNSYVFASPMVVNIDPPANPLVIPVGGEVVSDASGNPVSGTIPTEFTASAQKATTLVVPADFAPFEHPGGGAFTLPTYAAAHTATDVSGGNLVLTQHTSAQVTLSVSYDFTPTSTPEPAGIGLLAGVLTLAAVLLRRGRSIVLPYI
ncbi:MAG TPA: choice-of-anchor E domain-containing protein [Candidatus Limnocylindrales bacterium]|nr:choice-of-anchor E domain-containing protein [Candidatus Limnocylindrales bacterium]